MSADQQVLDQARCQGNYFGCYAMHAAVLKMRSKSNWHRDMAASSQLLVFGLYIHKRVVQHHKGCTLDALKSTGANCQQRVGISHRQNSW